MEDFFLFKGSKCFYLGQEAVVKSVNTDKEVLTYNIAYKSEKTGNRIVARFVRKSTLSVK